jgi:hypothetical protein
MRNIQKRKKLAFSIRITITQILNNHHANYRAKATTPITTDKTNVAAPTVEAAPAPPS